MIGTRAVAEVFVVTESGVRRGRLTLERTRRAASRRDSPLGPPRLVSVEHLLDSFVAGKRVTTPTWTEPRRMHPALVRETKTDAEALYRAARARAGRTKLPKVRAKGKAARLSIKDAAIAIAEERGR